MFALTGQDIGSRILGCADGPASFNAEATSRGARVVSCDPLYRFERDEIERRIAETRDRILEQTRLNSHQFVWSGEIRTPEDLGRVRADAMRVFLDDYDAGRASGRYLDAELPALPFADRSFDLAVCSHLVFLYSGQLGEAFHRAALHELCRVATEVRVFPLVALDGLRSPFVERCVEDLERAGYATFIEPVAYEFQRGANQMLRVRPQ